MPVEKTDAWHKRRRKGLGGSDLSELMLDVGNAHAVYSSKVYELDDTPNEAMLAGTLLEGGVLDWAEMTLGKLRRQQRRRVKGTPIATNIDAIIDSNGEPVEAKTSGIVSRFAPTQAYGDEGTDEVPDRVIIQTHAHMMAVDKDVCHVPVLIGGRGFLMFRVERNTELVEAIAEISNRFWTDHVVKSVPPDESWSRLCAPSLGILKRVRREPGKIIPVEPTAVELWEKAKAARLWIKDAEESAQARVLDMLGDAEAGQLPDGRQVTYKQQNTGGLRTKDLRLAYPEIAKEFANTKTHGVLRITKGTSNDRQLTSDND